MTQNSLRNIHMDMKKQVHASSIARRINWYRLFRAQFGSSYQQAKCTSISTWQFISRNLVCKHRKIYKNVLEALFVIKHYWIQSNSIGGW